MATMADLADLREMSEKIKKQSTYRMRFEDALEELRKPGARVLDGVVLPGGAACYVAERRQRSTREDESGMYWHVAYANTDQMAVVRWVLACIEQDDAA